MRTFIGVDLGTSCCIGGSKEGKILAFEGVKFKKGTLILKNHRISLPYILTSDGMHCMIQTEALVVSWIV